MNQNLADSLQLDHDACGNLNSMIVPCCGDLRELKGGHYHKIVEITEDAGKCLLHEYTVRLLEAFWYDVFLVKTHCVLFYYVIKLIKDSIRKLNGHTTLVTCSEPPFLFTFSNVMHVDIELAI
jgi:hypothetical protein